MDQFFAANYSGPPFELFGLAHLLALACVVGLSLGTWSLRNTNEKVRRRIRLAMAATLWLDETAWHLWVFYWGIWQYQYMLPLNVCSIFIWLTGFMLIFRSYRIYEFAYFLGIGAAVQYLLTPDLGVFGFPHFRFFQAFISHGLIVVAAIYMTVVEGFRPTWRSVLRVLAWANLYALAMFFVNLALGSNYLMVNAKPGTPSLLDLLPPWPFYLIFVEAIGIATFLLLYLPFFLKDRRANTQRTRRANRQ